jgi:hypothetical protein
VLLPPLLDVALVVDEDSCREGVVDTTKVLLLMCVALGDVEVVFKWEKDVDCEGLSSSSSSSSSLLVDAKEEAVLAFNVGKEVVLE